MAAQVRTASRMLALQKKREEAPALMAPKVRTASRMLALQKQCARKGFRASCISQHTGPVAAGPQGSAGLPQPFMKRHDQVAGVIPSGGVGSRTGHGKNLLGIR